MEKQIEEMARLICGNFDTERGMCCEGTECDHDCWAYREATHLHNAGYRKVVMCKDCKICDFGYFEKRIGEEAIEGYYCRKYREMKLPNDFCSDGIRKGN